MTTTRQCPSCGADIKLEERFCPNCGSRQPDATPPAATEPTIMVTPPQTPTPATPPPVSQPAFVPPPSQPVGSNMPPTMPYDPTAGAAPPAKRGMPIWLMIVGGIVGLCMLGCIGLYVSGLFLGSKTSQLFSTTQAQLSTSVVELPTLAAQMTAATERSPVARTAVAGGGDDVRATADALIATAQAVTNATPGTGAADAGMGAMTAIAATIDALGVPTVMLPATAEPAASPVALSTAEPAASPVALPSVDVQAIYAQSKQVFRDEFVDNRNRWFTGRFNDIETDVIEDGVFKVKWDGKGNSYELYEVRPLTNFIADVDCLVLNGDTDGSCGVIFGLASEKNYYKFEVFHDYYRMFAYAADVDKPPMLAEGDEPLKLLTAGKPFKLRVIKRGSEIMLFIEDRLVSTVNDTTYPTGKVGVSTNSYKDGPGIEVWFDNFTIHELP